MSRRLSQYPSAFSRAIADMLCRTALRIIGTCAGPGDKLGALVRGTGHVSSWSSKSVGVSILNETCSQGEYTVIDSTTAAAYIHVDDVVCLGSGIPGPFHSDRVVEESVDKLVSLGFEVSQVMKNDVLKKVVGYEVFRSPAYVAFPLEKCVLLKHALLKLTCANTVNTSILHSLLGI